MLHIVNKSPYEKRALESCLRFKRKGSALLLIEDAVYAAVKSSEAQKMLAEAGAEMPIYVLAPDVEARGLAGKIMEGVTPVDYGGFVDLVAHHNTSQSWL